MNRFVIPPDQRERIRRAVLTIGQTQAERAARLHVSVRQVQKYEAGRLPRVLFTFVDAGILAIAAPEPTINEPAATGE